MDSTHNSINIGSYGGVTWFVGRIYRTFGANFLPTASERTTLFDVLGGTYT